MKLSLSAMMLAACALAGCQTVSKNDRAVPQPPAPQQAAAAPANVTPVPAPPPPKPRPPRRPTPPAAAAPVAIPIVLVGLSRPELARTLGEPTERAEQNPGQTWVYRATGCSVEVLFLFDVVRNEMFAIDRKIVGTDGSERAEQQCLQRIKAAHAS